MVVLACCVPQLGDDALHKLRVIVWLHTYLYDYPHTYLILSYLVQAVRLKAPGIECTGHL